MKDPQRVSNLRKFKDNYDWSGLEFPVSIKDIGKLENRNNISVKVLAVEGRDIYIHRKGQRVGREINLLMVSEDGIRHYTAIKSLTLFGMGGHYGHLQFFLNISRTTSAKTIKFSDF